MDSFGVVLEPLPFAPVGGEEEAPTCRGVEELPADEVLLPASGLTQQFRVSQQSLGLAQRLLGAYALGDVERDANNPRHIARQIAEWLELKMRSRGAGGDLEAVRLPRQRAATPSHDPLAVRGLHEPL